MSDSKPVVKQNLSNVLYIAADWIEADRRRVAERVREACAQIAHSKSWGMNDPADKAGQEIRALDLDKLLEEE